MTTYFLLCPFAPAPRQTTALHRPHTRSLSPQLPGVLRVLVDRLRNEITRLTAVKAITTLAASPHVPSELLAGPAGPGDNSLGLAAELTSFLRKANRLLRQASLVALEVRGVVGCGNGTGWGIICTSEVHKDRWSHLWEYRWSHRWRWRWGRHGRPGRANSTGGGHCARRGFLRNVKTHVAVGLQGGQVALLLRQARALFMRRCPPHHHGRSKVPPFVAEISICRITPTLQAMAARHPAAFEGPALGAAVEEAAALVSDGDVALASLALRLLVTLLRRGPAGAAAVVAERAQGPALALVRSPLLQVGEEGHGGGGASGLGRSVGLGRTGRGQGVA